MKRKNAFTLIETMGVLILLGVIVVLVIPSLTKWLKSADSSIDEATKKLIMSASEDYVNDSDDVVFDSNEYQYCLELGELIDKGYISTEAVKDIEDENLIVSITYKSGKSNYEIVDECNVNIE